MRTRYDQWLLALVVWQRGCVVQGLTTEQWKHRTIYQVLTDRFALEDGASCAACAAPSPAPNSTAGLAHPNSIPHSRLAGSDLPQGSHCHYVVLGRTASLTH